MTIGVSFVLWRRGKQLNTVSAIITSLKIGSLFSCRWNASDLKWVHNLCVSNMLSMDLMLSKMAPNGGWFCEGGGLAATSAHVRVVLEVCDGVFVPGSEVGAGTARL